VAAEMEAKKAAARQKEKERKIHNNDMARDSKKEYKNFVTKVEDETETFLTDVEIEAKHSEARKKALDHFEKHQIGDSISNSAIIDELEKVGNWLNYIAQLNYIFNIIGIRGGIRKLQKQKRSS